MKSVFDLYQWINKNPDNYFENTLVENGKPKILFIKPQLLAKDFYRYLTPYFSLKQLELANTAITELGQYESKNNADVKMPITISQIRWANYIVFPFTTQPLMEVFYNCKKINDSVKIIFSVDFNFYELSQQHPQYKTFEPNQVKKNIEQNMLHCDTIMVSNATMVDYLEKKIPEINTIGKKEFDIITLPYLINYAQALETIDTNKSPEHPKNNKIRIGIIATENNWEDMNSYRKEFEEIHQRHKEKLQFVLIGFNGTDQATMKNPVSGLNFEVILNKNNKPLSIINYFNSLYNANLDAVFIPTKKTVFNETSENINRFLEAAAFNIPVIVADVFPYNKIIKDKSNGFLFSKKADMLLLIDAFISHPEALKLAGEKARRYTDAHFVINQNTAATLYSLFVSQ